MDIPIPLFSGLAMYFNLVSGFLVTREDIIFKDPLLGTFEIKYVLAENDIRISAF